MNWDAVGAVSEFVGAIAVVITLAYLAVQIRNQTEESRLTATRDLSRDYLSSIDSITSDKEVFSLYLRALDGYEALPREERIRISMIFFRVFRVSEVRYLHYLNKTVEAAHFKTGQLPLQELMKFPGLRAWWQHNQESFNEEFRLHIQGLTPEIDPSQTQ